MEYQDNTQNTSEIFSDFNLTSEEVNILRKARIVPFYNGTIKVLLGSVPEDQFKDILEVCKNKQGIIIKLFQEDIPAILRQGITLSEREYDIEYSCDTVAQAPLELVSQLGIRRVLIGAKENVSVQIIDREKYTEIYKRMQYLVKDISIYFSEKMRFKEVYTNLANYLNYDYKVAKIVMKMDEDEIKNDGRILAAGNLEGAILKRKCVCVGFAEALRQTLSLVGIKSEMCYSEFDHKNIGHIYNQVRIDGKWYNADLAMDYEDVRRRFKPRYCLKSDEDFAIKNKRSKYYHMPISIKDSHRCLESLEIYQNYRSKRHNTILTKIKRFLMQNKNRLLLGSGSSDSDIKRLGVSNYETKRVESNDITTQKIDVSKDFRESYKVQVQSDKPYIKEQDTEQIQKSEEERGI